VNVFFEESGSFKAGSVLSRQGDAFQVELPGGRRAKVRAKDVLIEFDKPTAGELMEQAEAAAQEIDLDFLWECAPADEFPFTALAAEYFGETSGATERASLVLRLHGSPVYFRRKGRGQYQRAPEEQLKMALASLERKRQQALVQAGFEEELKAAKLPEAFQGKALGLLTKPDKNSIEYKALEAAAAARGISMPRLMLECGGIASPRALHEARFLAEFFPHGTGFPAVQVGVLPDDLPEAHVVAFSIDDVTTTEIDDAFSVLRRADGGWRVGVHIAAPALSIADGTELDRWARKRLSTIYMPGHKITMLPPSAIAPHTHKVIITMLPPSAIAPHTLAENQWVPALSLYFDLAPSLALERTETQLERVFIAANLRLNALEPHFNEQTLSDGLPEPFPWRDELKLLWDVATVFEAGRGKPSVQNGIVDFLFYVDWAITTEDGPGFVTLVPRPRGAPLDKLVSEWAIATNVRWGEWLRAHDVAGIYRGQPPGEKVRMSIHTEPHEGLGVPCYLWATSPLRRYVDLANQRQLLATLGHGEPLPADRLAELIPAFETRYAQYQEWQRHMERYWALRWLRQERVATTTALVLRENWVRLESAPLAVKVPSLPLLASGTRVRIAIETVDLVDLDLKVRYVATV